MATHLDPKKNHLLAALPADEWARWLPSLEPVDMPLGEVLYESGMAMTHVYFPTTSIVSLLYVMEDGASAEIAVVGNEGIVGVSLLYKIPLLMLITDRGSFGEKDPWQTEGGKYTRPVLDALHIAHDDLRRPDEVQPKIAHGMTLAQASLSPVALLLQRDLMWEEPK